MLNARKQALENTLRQRLVTIRQNELEYYTSNCRSIGDAAALISGLAYSGIRYHYLMERNHNYQLSTGDSLEECLFLSLLSVTLGCGLQTVFLSTLLALLAPQLALRGPDGSLHDAVEGMHQWNSVVLAFFMTSLMLLQLSAFSFMYGHAQLGFYCRSVLCAAISISLLACLRYARIITRRLALPRHARVSGAFFATEDGSVRSTHVGPAHVHFDDCAPSSTAHALSSRASAKPAACATRISADEALPLTAESLDHALNQAFDVGLARGGAAADDAANAAEPGSELRAAVDERSMPMLARAAAACSAGAVPAAISDRDCLGDG